MRKEMGFWMLVVLFATACMSLGYVTAANSEESYDNAKVYALLYESGTKPYFSTNVLPKGDIPTFVQRGEMRCEGIEEESMTTGGAIVTTCIEIPPAARNISINGVAA
jgi:hypothetical protein